MTYSEFEKTIEQMHQNKILNINRQDDAIFLYEGLKLLEDYQKINDEEIPLIINEPDENSSLNHGMLIHDLKQRIDNEGNSQPGLPSNFLEFTDSNMLEWRIGAAKKFEETSIKIYDEGKEIQLDLDNAKLLKKILSTSNYKVELISKEANIQHPKFNEFLDFTINRDLAIIGVENQLVEVGANIHSKGTSVKRLRNMGLKKLSETKFTTNNTNYGNDNGLDMDDIVNKILGHSGGTRTIAGIHAALQADTLSSVIMAKATVKSKDEYSDAFSSPGVGNVYLLKGKLGLGNINEKGKLIEPVLEPVLYKISLNFSNKNKASEMRAKNPERPLTERKSLKLNFNIDTYKWASVYNSRGYYDLNKSSLRRFYSANVELSNTGANDIIANYNPFAYFTKK